MKITRRQIRKLIKEMSDTTQGDDSGYLDKIKIMLDSDPSMENINQMHVLADSARVNMKKFSEIAYPAFLKAVEAYSSVTVDNVKEFHAKGVSLGFSSAQMKPVMSSAMLKASQSYSKPTLQDIKSLQDLAKSMNLELDQINSIVMKMVERSNVLEQISVDNIVYEIDDVLFRARTEGLRTIGLQGVDALERSGQLSEDQVYDTDIELVYSVKNAALKAIERSISQIIMMVLK